jgi:DNA-binding IclR family transcriptional regulator
MTEEEGKTFLPFRFRHRDEVQDKLRPGGRIVVDAARVPSQPNQSVMDAVRLLQAVTFHSRAVSASEIARELGIEVTRAHRLLRTLSLLGMTFQTRKKRFTPGPAMHVLATQALLNSDLAYAARGPLDSLHQETGLEVAMGMLWQDYVSYIYHASPDMPIEAAAGQVSIFPASYSSLGRILMSSLPEEQVRAIYADRKIVGYEDAGIDALLDDLRTARADGFARVERKTLTGRVTIAICLPSRPFAAIGVGGEIAPEQTQTLLAKLRRAAAQIDAELDRAHNGESATGV